jgi:uncharacterized membrane protein
MMMLVLLMKTARVTVKRLPQQIFIFVLVCLASRLWYRRCLVFLFLEIHEAVR